MSSVHSALVHLWKWLSNSSSQQANDKLQDCMLYIDEPELRQIYKKTQGLILVDLHDLINKTSMPALSKHLHCAHWISRRTTFIMKKSKGVSWSGRNWKKEIKNETTNLSRLEKCGDATNVPLRSCSRYQNMKMRRKKRNSNFTILKNSFHLTWSDIYSAINKAEDHFISLKWFLQYLSWHIGLQ